MKLSKIAPHLFDIYLYLKLKKVNSGKFGNSDTPSVFSVLKSSLSNNAVNKPLLLRFRSRIKSLPLLNNLYTMAKRLLFFVLCMSLGIHTLTAQGTRLLRQPTISSKHIVFVYADDLWRVDRDGGNAERLTSHEGTESFPHFSPDGKMVAFSAQYDGNTDVFVVNTEGGEPRRLTFHPDADIVQGWTPDGKQVLFRSGRAGVPTMINHFYTVGLEGGIETKMPIPQASFGEISEDGNYVAYTPITL